MTIVRGVVLKATPDTFTEDQYPTILTDANGRQITIAHNSGGAQDENIEGIALASAARTATANSADLTNHNGDFLTIFVDVTVDPATASITPSVQVKDSISGSYHTVWTAAAAFAAVGTFVYQLGPGLLAGAPGGYTDAENVVVRRTFRVVMTAADAGSITYSADYTLN